MQVVDRPRLVGQQPRRRLGLERPGAQPLGQALPFDQVHGEVVLPIELADLENADDAGVPQPRRGTGFLIEAAHGIGRGKLGREDHLHRHLPAEINLPRTIDHAHPAAAQLGEQLVAAEAAWERWPRVRRLRS